MSRCAKISSANRSALRREMKIEQRGPEIHRDQSRLGGLVYEFMRPVTTVVVPEAQRSDDAVPREAVSSTKLPAFTSGVR